MKKQVILIIIFLFIVMPFYNVEAKTLQDYYNELSSLEKSYSDAKNKANMTQAELNKVKSEIASAEKEIVNASNEIDEAEKGIKESEESIEEKKEQTNQMLLYLQLSNNEDSYLEYLFEASDYTDFIYRYSIVTQLGDYNNKLMDELNTLINELQTKKQELANKQVELENKKKELQSKYAIIQVQYQEEQDDGISIKDQITQLKKSIKSYEARCGSKTNIDVNSCGGAAAAVDGWSYPLSSFTQSSIYREARTCTNKITGLKYTCYHNAVDLAVSEGNAVYAVANGEVISVTTSTCGGMVIQIKHTLDDGAKYVSLYMHLLEGYVKTGENVTGGQKIGLSGGGSQEIAKWGDTCTEGAHLHFAMSSGESKILSSSIQGSTIDPVRFFPAMSGYGAHL